MHPTEFTFYKALVLLTSAAGIGFGITNIVYYNKIRLKNNCGEISSGEATTLIWLNIILVILAAILFFWSLFRLIFSGKPVKPLVNQTINTHTHNYASPTPDPKVSYFPSGASITSYPPSPTSSPTSSPTFQQDI